MGLTNGSELVNGLGVAFGSVATADSQILARSGPGTAGGMEDAKYLVAVVGSEQRSVEDGASRSRA